MRYMFAREILSRMDSISRVLDAGCGIGYGSAILAEVVGEVDSIDMSEEAEVWHREYFSRSNVNYICDNVITYPYEGRFDAVVCFEFLEHVHEAADAIRTFGKHSDILICSTPNEEVRPHKTPPVNEFHVRHYTPGEFEELLAVGGFEVRHWFAQLDGANPELIPGTDGKFIVAVAAKPGVGM